MNLREQDIHTIRAFLITLAELKSPLDESLQKQLNQLGKQLSTDVTAAVENLRQLIYQHEFLKELYKPNLEFVQLNYQVQPRNKCILPSADSEPEGENLERENFILPTDSLKLIQHIFESNNSGEITKDIQQQLQIETPNSISPNESPDSPDSRYHDWIYNFFG